MGIIKSLIKSGSKIMYVEDNVWKELVGVTIPTEDDYVSKGMTLDTITKELWAELGKVKIEILSYTVDDTTKDWFVSMDTKPFSPLDILNKEMKFDVLHYEEGRSENPILEVGYKATPPPPIYGVKIDTNNSNPETSVTYTDMATDFTPAFCNNGDWQMGSWENEFPFNEIKPCVLKDGVVNYYLNPNDYTQKLDGGVADITSGNDGDVMVEFPKIYWKFERIGTDLHVRYSDIQVDEGYKCLAHTVGNTEKDKIYISAYRGFSTGGKLRSLSGNIPTASQTIGQFRSLAQANGVGYQQMAYYPLLMLQVLALVAGKNRDTQTQLGRGYVYGNASTTNTGQTNTKGMYYGETTGKKQNKFCGIEDFWGNQECWIDGIFSNTSWNMLISDQTVFNDTGAGYVNHGQGATANLGGYIDDVQGGTETGFIIKGKAGSATTHYSDNGSLYGGFLASLPGTWYAGDNAGAFGLGVGRTASSSQAYIGARLCNLG